MTSFGTKEICEPGHMSTFTVQGQVYHAFRSLLPMPEAYPKFLQNCFMGDATAEVEVRQSNIPGLKKASF